MAIQKVSDLESLNVSTVDKELLDDSLVEISYLTAKDDYNHRWYKSMTFRYKELCEDVIKHFSDGDKTFEGDTTFNGDCEINGDLRIRGNFYVNDVDEDGNPTEHDQWSKYESIQKYGLFEIWSDHSCFKDKDGNEILCIKDGDVYYKGKKLSDWITDAASDILHDDTLIRAEKDY